MCVLLVCVSLVCVSLVCHLSLTSAGWSSASNLPFSGVPSLLVFNSLPVLSAASQPEEERVLPLWHFL